MAEKKDMTEQETKKPESVKEKKPSLGKRISAFFKDYKSEFKKITWSSKKDVIRNTAVVLAIVVVAAIVVSVLDVAFSEGLSFIAKAI